MRLIEQVEAKDSFITKITEKPFLTEKTLEEYPYMRDIPIYSTLEIPIWAKRGFNKNGRNYSRVFEKVLTEEKNKITLGLIGHLEGDEEQYSSVALVCRNPHIMIDKNGEEFLGVFATIVGRPEGEKLEAILRSSGYLMFSSVADGQTELGSDGGQYVIPEGFSVYRWLDCVFGASNGLEIYQDHIVKTDIPSTPKEPLYDADYDSDPVTSSYNVYNQVMGEKTETKSNKTDRKNVTIYNDSTDSNNGEKIMSDKLLEKVLESNIKSLIKDAEKTENLTEKKTILLSALESASNLTETKLKETIEVKITETESALNDLAEKGKTVDKLNESITTISTEKDSLMKQIKTLKEAKDNLEKEYETIVSLYEKKQYQAGEKSMNTIVQLDTVVANLKEKNRKLQEENRSLITRKNLLEKKSNRFEASANSKVDADLVASLKESNEALMSKVISLTEALRKERAKKLMEKREVLTPRFAGRFDEIMRNRRIIERTLSRQVDENGLKDKPVIETNVDNILEKNGLV